MSEKQQIQNIESHFWSFFNAEKYADLIFISGDSKFYAHSLILIARAPEFYDKFVKNKRSGYEVELLEIFGSADAFQEFLRFIYLKTARISQQNYADIVRLASSFDLDALANECFTFIKYSITIEKACELLQEAVDGNYSSHIDFILDFIRLYFNSILTTPAFLEISLIALQKILYLEGIEVGDELDVFNAVAKWSENQISKQPEKKFDGSSMRQLLSDLLYLIRFPLITNSELIMIILNYPGLLNNDEIVGIYLERNGHVKNDFRFRGKSRFLKQVVKNKLDKLPIIKYASELQINKPRHEVTLLSGGYAIAPGMPSALVTKFKTSESIAVIGALVNGSQYRNVNVTMHLFNEHDRKLADGKAIVSSGQTTTVFFDTVILTNIDSYYKITLSYEEFGLKENVKHFEMLKTPVKKIVNYVEYTFTELSPMLVELYVK